MAFRRGETHLRCRKYRKIHATASGGPAAYIQGYLILRHQDPILQAMFGELGGRVFIQSLHHPKSVFNLGSKIGPGLNENDFHEFFLFRVSTTKWKTAKAQSGGAEGAALLFSIWQWKPGIENRLWVVLALNKNTRALIKKHRFLVLRAR